MLFIKIFEWNKCKDPFNYFKIGILFPMAYWRSYRVGEFGDIEYHYGFNADTGVVFVKDEKHFDIFWSFRVSVLGFGFQILRQKGF